MTSYLATRRIMQSWCLTPLFLLVLVFGCKDNEVKPLFEKNTLARSQGHIDELRKLLKSSEFGWVIDYQPDADETGIYSFIFKFLSDNMVAMSSDFSKEDATPTQSEYAILQGSTTKLSFTTRGAIHKLSDSNLSPIPNAAGSGLKGDFEFLYYGETEGGDLIFRTNREQDTLIFRKATAESQTDLEASVANLEALENVGSTSGYRSLDYSKNGTIVRSGFQFSSALRRITIRRVRGAAFTAAYQSRIRFGSDGIRIDSIKIGSGKEEVLRDIALQYDPASDRFIAQLEDGATVSIRGLQAPPVPVSDHKTFLDKATTAYLWFFHRDEDIDQLGLTTASVTALYDRLHDKLLSDNVFDASFRLYVDFLTDEGDFSYFPGQASVAGMAVEELLVYEDRGDRLVIYRRGQGGSSVFTRPARTVSTQHETAYNHFLDLLTDSEGFYVENLGTLTRYCNHIYTFTSVRDPSIRIAFYHVDNLPGDDDCNY